MALVKSAPPTVSSIIVSILQIASLAGAVTLTMPQITVLGPALDVVLAGLLYAAQPALVWVKNWWDTRRVASPQTTVPMSEKLIDLAEAGVEIEPEILAAARRVLNSPMRELAAK